MSPLFPSGGQSIGVSAQEPGSLWSMGLQRVRYAYVKRIASPGSMHDTGCLGLVHWDDPDGWDGEGGGRVVQDGEHMYSHGGFKSKYGKTNTMLKSKIN